MSQYDNTLSEPSSNQCPLIRKPQYSYNNKSNFRHIRTKQRESLIMELNIIARFSFKHGIYFMGFNVRYHLLPESATGMV